MDIVTNKGKECLLYEGNKYRKYYTKKNDIVCWRCTIKCCNARLESNNGTVVKQIGDHNHAETVVNPSAVSLRVACKRKASQDISVRPSKIIRSTVASDVSGVASETLTTRDVINCRAAIYRQRRKQYGTLPHSLSETIVKLRVMPMTTHKKEDFLMYCEEFSSDDGMAIFTTSTNLRTLVACDTVLMDGTFKSCPRFFVQVYTIFAYANHTYLPLVYGLLRNKEQSTYETFLQTVINQCFSMNLVFKPAVVLTDFEKSAMNAVSALLPDSRLHGCRFHLGQSWWRRIQTLGLSEEYKDKRTEIGQWLLLFFGLSLLSPGDVSTAFTDEIMSTMPADDRCQRFADYVVENYVDFNSDFPVGLWAQSPDLNPATTNGAESFHGHMNDDFNTPHPNIYIFVESLLRQQTATYISIGSLAFTKTLPRAAREKTALLMQFYTDYLQGNITMKQYIQRVAYRVAPST